MKSKLNGYSSIETSDTEKSSLWSFFNWRKQTDSQETYMVSPYQTIGTDIQLRLMVQKCEEYNQYLLKTFESQFRYHPNYSNYYPILKNPDENVPLETSEDCIIRHLMQGKLSLEGHKKLKHLLEKYTGVTDIKNTLERMKLSSNNDFKHKCEEAVAKFIHHKELFLRDLEATDVQFLQTMAEHLHVQRFLNPGHKVGCWEAMKEQAAFLPGIQWVKWPFDLISAKSLSIFAPQQTKSGGTLEPDANKLPALNPPR